MRQFSFYIMFAFSLVGLGITFAKDGQRKDEVYNFKVSFISFLITVFLYWYWGLFNL